MLCYIFSLIRYYKISPNVSSNWYRVLQPKKSRRHKLSWQPEAFSYDLIIQNSLCLLHLKYKCVIRVTVVCMPSKCSGYYIFNSLCFTFMLTIGLFFLWACLEIFCKNDKEQIGPDYILYLKSLKNDMKREKSDFDPTWLMPYL